MYVFPIGMIQYLFLLVYVVVCDFMNISSVYVVSFTGACGIGVYMLNNLGDRTPPCGPPVLNLCYVNVLFLNVVYALRHLM